MQWRRVAQFEPVRVDGADFAQEEATDRASGSARIEAGMRVALRRDDEHGANAVRVESLDEQPLGYLPPDAAAWVAPLLESGRMAIDGRVYAVEGPDESTDNPPGFFITLTQFELRPVERSSLTWAFRAAAQLPLRGVNWCVARTLALYHAFVPTTVPRRDRYAADDSSGG